MEREIKAIDCLQQGHNKVSFSDEKVYFLWQQL